MIIGCTKSPLINYSYLTVFLILSITHYNKVTVDFEMPEFIEIEGTTFNVSIVLTLNTTELDEIMDEFEVVAIAQSGEGDSGASKIFTCVITT